MDPNLSKNFIWEQVFVLVPLFADMYSKKSGRGGGGILPFLGVTKGEEYIGAF